MENTTEKKRENNIDLYKAALVLGMILTHAFQLVMGLDNTPIDSSKRWMVYLNLVSFSGFLFCFGYSTYIAYLQKDIKEVRPKLIRNIIKLLIIFYISAIGYVAIILNEINFSVLIRILTLLIIPGMSEFLASFAMLNLFVLIFFKYIKKILDDNKLFFICIISSLFLTFIPYKFITSTWLGLIIGNSGICFPILQYMSLFLFGMYFAKNKPKFDFKIMIATLICFIIFEICVSKNLEIVMRFPPKLFWIVGSYFFVYIYYYITKYICEKYNNSNLLSHIIFIGRDSLTFLWISNIILFIITTLTRNVEVNFIQVILTYIVTVIMCYWFSKTKTYI